jgi:hypothetical protein
MMIPRINIQGLTADRINAAVFSTQQPWVFLVHGEIHLLNEQATTLLRFALQDQRTAIVQPKIHVIDTDLFHGHGGAGGLIDSFGVGYTRGIVFGDAEIDTGQYDRCSSAVDWINAAVMLVHVPSFRAACGLDASFGIQTAWMDLGSRLGRLGYQLACCHESTIRIGLPVRSDQSLVTLYDRGRYVIRHSKGAWLLLLLVWIIIEITRISGNLIQLRLAQAKLRTTSLFSLMKQLPDVIKDREIVSQDIARHRNAEVAIPTDNTRPVSIFWRHYARLGKTASNALAIFLVIASVFSLTMRDRR